MKLKNKKILVYGLGISGTATINFLLQKKAKIFFYDDNIEVFEKFKNENVTKFNLSLHLREIEMVVVAPGVYDTSYIKIFETLKIKILNEIELASIFVDKSKIIAITGTNGKTTTTKMVEKLLLDAGRKVTACGNLGVSFLEVLKDDKEDHFFVVEISSFQLERTKFFKPYISVVLNVSSDHLNRHKTFENYTNLKFSIAKRQDAKSYFILNSNLKDGLLAIKKNKSKALFFSQEDNAIYQSDGEFFLFNQHFGSLQEIGLSSNEVLDNFYATILIGALLKIENNVIKESVKSFKRDKHRVEGIGVFDGVEYIEDSKATNPASVVFALKKINNNNVILLLGGKDKDLNFDEIFSYNHLFKKIICFGEAGSKIFIAAKKAGLENIFKEGGMLSAVKKAKKISSKGDIVLLSPSCASFDEFKDYKERGEFFKRFVNAEYNKEK